MTDKNRKKIKLTSSPMVCTPGIVRWARHGYATSRTAKEKKSFVNVFREGYGLTKDAATYLLSCPLKDLDFNDEAESVSFTPPGKGVAA